MPVPARKLSRSKVRRRRSHDHMNPMNVGVCEKCKAPAVGHKACPSCGFYKGRLAVDNTKKAARLLKHTGHTHGYKDESKKKAS